MTNTFEALCGDCLRVLKFSSKENLDSAHQGKTLCLCGGEVCALYLCSSCNQTVERLRAGIRNHTTLGLNHPISDWSEQRGILNLLAKNMKTRRHPTVSETK